MLYDYYGLLDAAATAYVFCIFFAAGPALAAFFAFAAFLRTLSARLRSALAASSSAEPIPGERVPT